MHKASDLKCPSPVGCMLHIRTKVLSFFFLSVVRKQKALKLHKTEMVEAGGGDSHDDWVKGMTVNKEALDLISEQGK